MNKHRNYRVEELKREGVHTFSSNIKVLRNGESYELHINGALDSVYQSPHNALVSAHRHWLIERNTPRKW